MQLSSEGYILIRKPEHHFAQKKGVMPYHRLVWEEHNKATLLPWANIHHINGIKTDNRIENLQAMTKAQHLSHHKKQTFNRVCSICKVNNSINYLNRNSWLRHPNTKEWLCNKCYQRLWARKKYNLIGRI